jgi:hypothetical protein
MNTKRKLLTVGALVAFSVIMALHYLNVRYELTLPVQNGNGHWGWTHWQPILPAVHGFLLVLGVFYTALFALLGGEAKPKVAPVKASPNGEHKRANISAVAEIINEVPAFAIGLMATIALLIAGTLGTYLVGLLIGQ